jgi:hypothetical protein
MFTTLEFLTLAKWVGIAALVSLTLTVIAFYQSWGVRFRLVGLTGFLIVIVVGNFGLSLGLFQNTIVPGAAPFTVIYDTGGTQAVISVSNPIDAPTLEATLRQAAYKLFSSGRVGAAEDQLTIRARTLLHPKPGISQPIFLGQLQRSLQTRDDDNMQVEIDYEHLQQLQNLTEF